MPTDPYTDDEYDDTYKKVHGDEPARDQYTEGATDDTFFPSGVGRRFSPSGWGIWPSSDATEAELDERTSGDDTALDAEDDDESLWDGGLIGTILLAGIALFVFPEPTTSAIGIFLLGIGVVLWAIDWLA